MITTFYPPYHFGGDAVFIRRLAHSLARRGHQVEIIHDIDAFRLLSRNSKPRQLEEPLGVRTHPLHSRLGRLSTLATQQSGRPMVQGRQIRQILDRGEFDVLYFHNISLLGGPGVLAYGSGIKLYMAHEHWLVCPSHVLWRHNRELCTGRQCLRCVLHYHRPPQLWRYTGMLEKHVAQVDALISPSAFSASMHSKFGFKRNFNVIPYFLPDLESDAEAAETRAEDVWPRPYYLFVGRLEKIKGLQDVLPLFGPEAPADLVVVGTGTYEDALRSMASDWPKVSFLGFRKPEELRSLYRNALALIVPSICFETFGITILEAFRERTPVIARSLGPFVEIIEESGGGILFDSRSELSAAIDRLTNDTALRARLAEAGYNALCNYWVEKVVLQGYFGLIYQIAKKKGNYRVCEILDSATREPPAIDPDS